MKCSLRNPTLEEELPPCGVRRPPRELSGEIRKTLAGPAFSPGNSGVEVPLAK